MAQIRIRCDEQGKTKFSRALDTQIYIGNRISPAQGTHFVRKCFRGYLYVHTHAMVARIINKSTISGYDATSTDTTAKAMARPRLEPQLTTPRAT